MTPIPNYSQKTNFRLDIPNEQAEDFVINVQEVNVPSISIPATNFPINPTARGDLPGSAIEFEPITMRILLDENLNAYTDIYRWMLSIVDYKNSESTAWLPGGSPKTMLFHILDSTKEKILMTYVFDDPWPQMMGEIEFAYTDDVNLAMFCTVTFRYKTFTIEKNGVTIRPRPVAKGREFSPVSTRRGLHPSMR
ncbi:MAG: hypothetical protein [Caudoviricetes sp.]|nr:MAG: hypothetical protein [Caudoviricetes sp.]